MTESGPVDGSAEVSVIFLESMVSDIGLDRTRACMQEFIATSPHAVLASRNSCPDGRPTRSYASATISADVQEISEPLAWPMHWKNWPIKRYVEIGKVRDAQPGGSRLPLPALVAP